MNENTTSTDNQPEMTLEEAEGAEVVKLVIDHPDRTDELEEEDW